MDSFMCFSMKHNEYSVEGLSLMFLEKKTKLDSIEMKNWIPT